MPGWLRERARDLFTEIYDGLAEAAENNVRAVASRYAGDEVPGIRAHTVADLVTGFS